MFNSQDRRSYTKGCQALFVLIVFLLMNPKVILANTIDITGEGVFIKLPQQFEALNDNSVCQVHAINYALEMDLCVIIRPISMMEIEYNDPHSSAPHPNQLYPMLFASLVNELAKQASSPEYEYPQEQAKEKFNADWAKASAFDYSNIGVNQYKQGYLLGLHKHHMSDVYVLFSYSNEEDSKEVIKTVIETIRYRE